MKTKQKKVKRITKQKNYWNYLKLVSLAYLIYGLQHYTILYTPIPSSSIFSAINLKLPLGELRPFLHFFFNYSANEL